MPEPLFGVPVSWEQAKDRGVGPRAVRRLIRAGVAQLLPDGRVLIRDDVDAARRAVLALGSDVVVSLESAAVVHGWPLTTDVLYLSVPRTRTGVSWPGAVVRTRSLHESEICTGGALPVTTPEATILDLARWRGLRPAVQCLDVALAYVQTDTRRMRRALARRRRHPGTQIGEQVIALGCELRQSPLESLFRCLVHEAGLPPPVDQYELRHGGMRVGRVDFAWPDGMVVVELDGFEFHREYAAFQEDRRRDRVMRLGGWIVLRFTHDDLTSSPESVVADVRAALEDRGVLA